MSVAKSGSDSDLRCDERSEEQRVLTNVSYSDNANEVSRDERSQRQDELNREL